jgi:hypothetical protein
MHDVLYHVAITREKSTGNNEAASKAAYVWRVVFQKDSEPFGLQFATLCC